MTPATIMSVAKPVAEWQGDALKVSCPGCRHASYTLAGVGVPDMDLPHYCAVEGMIAFRSGESAVVCSP